LLFTIGLSVSAQSWKPFYKGDTVNFKFNNSNIVSNTIWVDSAKVVGSDSVFYLNRVFINCDTCLHIPGYFNCDTCFAIDNQPQFLQRTIIKKENGRYLLNDTSNIEIRTKAQLNDSWMFDAANSISAQVVEVSLQSVFGVNDSVKTIKLSNNDTIKLSKNHGFIQYPNLYGVGNYCITGIENRNLGEHVPDFWDIFDFNVGDVFQYVGRINDDGNWRIFEYVKKYYILSKINATNKITYDVQLIENGVEYRFAPPPYGYWHPYIYNYTTNIEFNNPPLTQPQSDLIINKYNHDKFISDECYEEYFYIVRVTADSLNIYTKTIGKPNFSFMFNVENSYIPCSIPNVYSSINADIYSGATYAEYKAGLGRTGLSYGCFEFAKYELLQGYIKNGDTVGVITSDGILLHLNESFSTAQNNITIYPNPFSEKTSIEIKGKQVDFPCILSLYNLQGQLIRKEKINDNTFVLNKEQLQNGMYLYANRDVANNIVGKGKLLVQ